MIRATIRHNGCWSPFLESFPEVKGELLTQNVNEDTVIGNAAFYSPRLKENTYFVDFYRSLQAMDAILEIKQVRSNTYGDKRFVNFVAVRNRSISNFVYESGSMIYKEFFFRGFEVWYFSPGVGRSKNVIDKISELATVLEWEHIPADQYFDMFSVLNDSVRPRYEDLLSFLVEKRYFDYPHGTTIEEIAGALGTSKSNVGRKIRNLVSDMAHGYQRRKEISKVVEQAVSKPR